MKRNKRKTQSVDLLKSQEEKGEDGGKEKMSKRKKKTKNKRSDHIRHKTRLLKTLFNQTRPDQLQ